MELYRITDDRSPLKNLSDQRCTNRSEPAVSANGFRNSSSQAFQAPESKQIVAHAAMCINHAERGLSWTGGCSRPKRSTIGVAHAHTTHEKSWVTNKWTQL